MESDDDQCFEWRSYMPPPNMLLIKVLTSFVSHESFRARAVSQRTHQLNESNVFC